MGDLLAVIVTGLLSGGLGVGIGTLIKARSEARSLDSTAKAIDAKLPVEVDSIAIQGAESAVLTMRSALESASARIAELEQDRAEDRKRIEALERKVEELRRKVELAEAALGDAREAGTQLRRELEQFSRDRDQRR